MDTVFKGAVFRIFTEYKAGHIIHKQTQTILLTLSFHF